MSKAVRLLTAFKGLTGIGLPLLAAGLLLEASAIFVRRWIAAPIPLAVNLRLILSVPCALISILGMIWFNRTLNLVRVYFFAGENQLITHGPFNYVRHPLYAALLSGVPPLFVIWYADLLFLVPWILMLILAHFMVRLEERGLLASFGDEYRAYMRYVPALLPYRGVGGRRFRERHDGGIAED